MTWDAVHWGLTLGLCLLVVRQHYLIGRLEAKTGIDDVD